MKRMLQIFTFLGLGAAAACADNPILSPDAHDDELEVEVSFSEEHLATLTGVEVEVRITDRDGAPVTDLDDVAVESRLEGEDEWSTLDLDFHDGHFSAEHMFYSSGEYEVRVVARRPGGDHADVIHERPGHLEVERVHREVGPYRVEMETYPGHLHEGDEAEVRFWVGTGGGDGHGGMSPMHGLDATVQIMHGGSGGSEVSHMADEHDPGVYEVHHTFDEHGEAEVHMGFDDGNGHHEVAFALPVDEGH